MKTASVVLAGRKLSLPSLLGPDHRQRCFEVGPRVLRREDDDAVIVGQDEVAWTDRDAAQRDRRVDRAAAHGGGASGGMAPAEDGEVGPAGEGGDVTDGAVDDDAGDALEAGGPGEQLADHGGFGPAAGIDHDHVARARHGDGVVDGAVVQGLAAGGDGRPGQPPAGPEGAERAERGVGQACGP